MMDMPPDVLNMVLNQFGPRGILSGEGPFLPGFLDDDDDDDEEWDDDFFNPFGY
jgi:hypothetical protein